jgi:hypothetical protein
MLSVPFDSLPRRGAKGAFRAISSMSITGYCGQGQSRHDDRRQKTQGDVRERRRYPTIEGHDEVVCNFATLEKYGFLETKPYLEAVSLLLD